MAMRFRSIFTAAVLGAAIAGITMSALAPAQAAEGRKKALITGLALGAVGGVVLDRVLQGNGAAAQPALAPAPVYDPQPTYAVPQQPVYAPRPAYAQPVRARPDPYFNNMSRLKAACDDGDTGSCIKFGIIIGQHKEREAEWRRNHPDMFEWDHS